MIQLSPASEAAHGYIEAYVAQTDSQLRQATLFEEARVLYAVLALSIVVVGHVTEKLDADGLRQLVDIKRYLQLLESRLDKLVTRPNEQENNASEEKAGYFAQMRQIMRHSLVWCNQRASRGDGFDEHVGCAGKIGIELSILRLITVEPELAGSSSDLHQIEGGR